MTIARGALLAGELARTQGFGWLAFRAWHAASRRSGLVRLRLPATSWDEQPLADWLQDPKLSSPDIYHAYRRTQAPPFFFDDSLRSRSGPLFNTWDRDSKGPIAQAGDLARGTFRYFEHTPVAAGFPPDWHANPIDGGRAPADQHWSRIGDFAQGDIKVIWELSRFGFTFPLVRAYWRTGDTAHAERFWQLVEDWREHNPPQQGANWKCGQETSLRVLAWCFGLYGFLGAPATTPERVADLVRMIAVSGDRIEATLNYALSQRNNHGISEGAGLWTIGLLFPELHPARRWRDLGRRVLERLGRDLIYEDGSFAQHSLNYHRLMLHAFIWSIRLGAIHGRPFSQVLCDRVAKAGAWLYQVQDTESGRAPCYGQHDGALALPLSNCDPQDFRPITQAAHFLATGARCHGSGPWDEDLFWLFGAEAVSAQVDAPERSDFVAIEGGYDTLRSPTGFVFTRCGSFRHRPGQADLLHVDLWWRGQNVALDAGTYSYNAPAPWDGPLARTACHNTVSVDDACQMERLGRFLWLPWARGRVRLRATSSGRQLAYWEGEHDGYERLDDPVRHRRAIVRIGIEHWLILDDVRGRAPHRFRLQWLLPDVPHQLAAGLLSLETPAGPFEVRAGNLNGPADRSLVRADPDGPRGWRSAYYMQREPALSLAIEHQGTAARFWTLLGPPIMSPTMDESVIHIDAAGWIARIVLGQGAARPLAAEITLETAMASDSLRTIS